MYENILSGLKTSVFFPRDTIIVGIDRQDKKVAMSSK